MANHFLAFGALVAFGWAFVNVSPPNQPARPAAPFMVKSDPTLFVAERAALEVHRAPVPLVRNARPPAAVPAGPAASPPGEESQVQDGLERRAAKIAIEADGYKRVN